MSSFVRTRKTLVHRIFCCVGYYEVLKINKIYGRLLSNTIDAFELNIEEKTTTIRAQVDKMILQHDNVAWSHNRWKLTCKRQNGKPYPTRRIHQTLSFRLSLVTIDGTSPNWTALLFLWRSHKMAKFLHRFKNNRIAFCF